MDPALRMLRLLSLLQTHRSWSGDDLAERLGVSGRTLRRDVDRLREFGYRVDAERGTDGGYRLEAGAELPPLVLDDDEAVAMVVGLRANAAGSVSGLEESSLRALGKIEQVLPARLQRQVGVLDASVEVAPLQGALRVDVGALMRLAHACRDCVHTSFAYSTGSGETSDRRVEPHKVVSFGQRWYLLGWDNNRNDWRTFRVDRIADVVTSANKFAPREVPFGDAADYVSRGADFTGRGAEISIVFDASVEQVSQRWPARGAEFETVDGERCRVRIRSHAFDWMAMSAGIVGFDFEVEKPSELAEYVDELGKRFSSKKFKKL